MSEIATTRLLLRCWQDDDLERLVALYGDQRVARFLSVDGRPWPRERSVGALEYTGNRDRFEVPVGMETDFASVPRVFVWFLPQYGRYTKAAILSCSWRSPSSAHRRWSSSSSSWPRTPAGVRDLQGQSFCGAV